MHKLIKVQRTLFFLSLVGMLLTLPLHVSAQGTTITGTGTMSGVNNPIPLNLTLTFPPAGGPVTGTVTGYAEVPNPPSTPCQQTFDGTITGIFDGGDGGYASGELSITYTFACELGSTQQIYTGSWVGNLYANGTGTGSWISSGSGGEWTVNYSAQEFQALIAPPPTITPTLTPQPVAQGPAQEEVVPSEEGTSTGGEEGVPTEDEGAVPSDPETMDDVTIPAMATVAVSSAALTSLIVSGLVQPPAGTARQRQAQPEAPISDEKAKQNYLIRVRNIEKMAKSGRISMRDVTRLLHQARQNYGVRNEIPRGISQNVFDQMDKTNLDALYQTEMVGEYQKSAEVAQIYRDSSDLALGVLGMFATGPAAAILGYTYSFSTTFIDGYAEKGLAGAAKNVGIGLLDTYIGSKLPDFGIDMERLVGARPTENFQKLTKLQITKQVTKDVGKTVGRYYQDQLTGKAITAAEEAVGNTIVWAATPDTSAVKIPDHSAQFFRERGWDGNKNPMPIRPPQ
ncbi:MAG TPA: hypothetical protein VN376_06835 [Longilinea sp.]|nr:hypothetical protein [Longilinea sp.]